MGKFRKKAETVIAITFHELVAHGVNQIGLDKCHKNGMPWSFQYEGQHISHETDDCYLIPTAKGSVRFNRGDMLITYHPGEIYPLPMAVFRETYESAE